MLSSPSLTSHLQESYATLLAVSFLIRTDKYFLGWRDGFLLVFLLTTYIMAPVSSFAMILCIMGLAQLPPEKVKWRLSYVFVFFLFQLWEFIPDVKDYFLEI